LERLWTSGVGHVASLAIPPISASPLRFPLRLVCPPSIAFGLGHEVQAFSFVGRSEAASWDSRRPDGVTNSFQVSRYNVEPSLCVFSRSLLAKDMLRA
jgi:hypothetical protein